MVFRSEFVPYCESYYENHRYTYESMYRVVIKAREQGARPGYSHLFSKGFHVFVNQSDAIDQLAKDYHGDAMLVECTIPKDSELYVGVWGDDMTTPQAVCNQIIIHKPKF